MTTVGLLISLDLPDPGDLLRRLSTHSALTVGAVAGHWLPVAAEAQDDAECREVHDWIAAQPGVAFVDVVHVSFDSDSTEPILNAKRHDQPT